MMFWFSWRTWLVFWLLNGTLWLLPAQAQDGTSLPNAKATPLAQGEAMGPWPQNGKNSPHKRGKCNAIPSWFDEMNGFALSGFDPVAYLTKKKAWRGVRAYQVTWCHTNWLFHNDNNLALFLRAPAFYQPVLSGYDAYGVSQGLLLRGDPQIWLRYKSRIFLFHNATHLSAFKEKRDMIADMALQKWPQLARRQGLHAGY